MTFRDQYNLVMRFAQVLYVNGQSTDETIAAADYLARTFGARAALMLRWDQIQLEVSDNEQSLVTQLEAAPTGVDMQRVAAASGAIANMSDGRLTMEAATSAIEAIAKTPPAPTWLFTVAAAVGAAA